MTTETRVAPGDSALLERRDRTRSIVEGALLTDIALVFLLMRVYLPLPPVRTLLRAVATVPIVMLLQRRGLKVTILAVVASYILFSALVGPLLALSAIDIGVAGILVGLGRRIRFGPGLNTLWTGAIYSLLDLVLPTIAAVIIFRYPVKQLVKSARNFVGVAFNFLEWAAKGLHFPPSAIHQLQQWKGPVSDHWQIAWLALTFVLGLLTMYLAVIASELVLRQLPEETLARQRTRL